MAEYSAEVAWDRNGELFTDSRYSRGHRWRFDGGIEVRASSSPHVVRLPLSIAEAVDPEEALVASLSSCHMLGFLSIAAKRGFVVDSYRDQALGVMTKNESGRLAITRVTLRPAAQFGGERRPTAEQILAMHHDAHNQCIIAASVKTDLQCEPVGLAN